MITIKSAREVETMMAAGRILAETLQLVEAHTRPGTTTEELDRLAEDFIRSYPGARPSFKGLYDFPKSLCTSINDEVVHGIPSDDRELHDGDILSVDCGVCLEGLHADSALTIAVGEIPVEVERLLSVTREALRAGISAATEGRHTGDIGYAVQQVAEAAGYSVVRELVGHGIGTKGMTIAIEPMINAGGPEIKTLSDRWTVVTADGSLSAHFEHTVEIHPNGPQILTAVPATTPA